MRVLIIALIALLIAAIAVVAYYTRMPAKSFAGPAIPFTAEVKQLAASLKRHVTVLAGEIGERNTQNLEALNRAADYIGSQLRSFGCTPQVQEFVAARTQVKNIYCELQGTTNADEIVVFGAHYDSVLGTPGADDNASGVAALLEIARLSCGQKFTRTVQFVFFVNEEPPFFQTSEMGSFVYAQSLEAANRNVRAMVAVESIGFYSDTPESHTIPQLLRRYIRAQETSSHSLRTHSRHRCCGRS